MAKSQDSKNAEIVRFHVFLLYCLCVQKVAGAFWLQKALRYV